MSASARHSKPIAQHRSRARVWLCRLGSTLIALVAATLLAFAGLQTPWAKQKLVTWLNATLSTANQEIRMEGLSGWLPQQARLDSLSLADHQGPWLQLKDIQLDWSPMQWFRGRLHIHTIAAQHCRILRLPAGGDTVSAQDLHGPIALPEVTILDIRLAQLELSPAAAGKWMRLGIDGSVHASSNLQHIRADLRSTGDLALNAKLEVRDKKLSLFLNADQGEAHVACAYAIQDGHLDLADIETTIPGVQLRGQASVHLSTGLIDGTAITEVTDAASFAALFDQKAQGQMTVKTTLQATGQRQDLHMEAEAANLVWSDLTAASLQGSADLTDVLKHPKGQASFKGRDMRWQHHQLSDLSLDAEGDLDQGGVDVTTAGVWGQAFTLNSQATWQREAEDWQVTLKTLQTTYDQIRFGIKPQGSLALQQSGTEPITLGIQACELTVGEQTLPLEGTVRTALSNARLSGDLKFGGKLSTHAKFDMSLPIKRPQGNVQLELVRHDTRIQGRAAYALSGSHIHLTDLAVLAPGAELTGQAAIELERYWATGSIQAKVTDAASLARFSGIPVQGQGQGLVTFSVDGNDQLVDSHWQLSDVDWTALHLVALEGDASLRINEQDVTGKASSTAHGITWNQLHLDQTYLEASGDTQTLAMTVMSQGSLKRPFASQAHGIVTLDQTAPLFVLDQAQVLYGSQQLTLRQEAILLCEVYNDAPIYTLQDCLWQADNGVLSVEGQFSPQNLDLKASLLNIDIGSWTDNPDLTGTLNGSFTLSGSPQHPCVESLTQIRGLGLRDGDTPTITHLDADVICQLTGQDLYTNAHLSTVDGDHVTIQAEVPVSFSMAPWQWTLHDQNLHARFNADTDVAMLDWLPVFREAVLQGRIQADMGYTGSFSAGTLSGSAQWENGYYEDIILGTVIPNIHATLTAKNRDLILSAKTSDDKGAEQVAAQGEFKLSKSQNFPYALEIQANRFPWIQRSDVSVIASGKVTLSGSIKHILLHGDLTADHGLLDLNAMPSAPPPLITPPPQTMVRAKPTPSGSPAPELIAEGALNLDLGDDFQIVGQDLNSLWRGRITLNLSNKNWDLTGNVFPQRGDFRILGRPFRLAQGSIRLDGVWPADPILDLTAVHHRAGIEARIHISGRSSNPIVSLQSDPPLPEDAILATVLFGKELSTITAMQAVQLGTALKNLHSRGGGIDLFRSTRRVLGIDYIDIQKPDERSDSLSLAVGKQVRSDVYVELQRHLSQEGATSTHVEYEIRPNLTLETDAGPGIRPGLGLSWKKDY